MFSDGADIDDISPSPDGAPDEEQDESSNSSTEKTSRKRPLRNRDSNQPETKVSKCHNDSLLFGIPISGYFFIGLKMSFNFRFEIFQNFF